MRAIGKIITCIQTLIGVAIVYLLLAILFGSEAWARMSGPEAFELNVRLTAGGYSTHLLSENVTNESHDHFAVQVAGVELGRFNNSYGRESYYLAYEATWKNVLGPHVDAFLKSGVVYGYVDCIDRGSSVPKKRDPIRRLAGSAVNTRTTDDVDTSGAWCPMVAPGLRYTQWEIEPELTLAGDAVNLGVSYEFDLMRL